LYRYTEVSALAGAVAAEASLAAGDVTVQKVDFVVSSGMTLSSTTSMTCAANTKKFVDGRVLSLAYTRPRVYASSQLF
jgi:hypothetical protein